jgi:hypothetical protein
MTIATSRLDGASSVHSPDIQPPSTNETRTAQSNRIEKHSLSRTASARARHQLIAEAAYRRAEQRGFGPGEDWEDWFAAEREVDALLDPDL